MKFLITGSREAGPRLIDMASQFVRRFAEHEFVVGDAYGVDAAVIKACDDIGAKVTVYGAYNKLRNITHTGKNVPLEVDYPKRDRHMASLDIDCCVAFWNGKSRGTINTAKTTQARGIKTYVVK
jgi:hypothetical protein